MVKNKSILISLLMLLNGCYSTNNECEQKYRLFFDGEFHCLDFYYDSIDYLEINSEFELGYKSFSEELKVGMKTFWLGYYRKNLTDIGDSGLFVFQDGKVEKLNEFFIGFFYEYNSNNYVALISVEEQITKVYEITREGNLALETQFDFVIKTVFLTNEGELMYIGFENISDPVAKILKDNKLIDVDIEVEWDVDEN